MKDVAVGLLESRDQAQFAVWDLVNCGFPKEAISIRTTEIERHFLGDEGESVIVKGSAQMPAEELGSRGFAYLTEVTMGPGDMVALAELGIPEAEARFYYQGMQRGGFLVTVTTESVRAEEAGEILRRHGAVIGQERMETWRGDRVAGAMEPGLVQPGSSVDMPPAYEDIPLSRATLQEQLERAELFGAPQAESAQPSGAAMSAESTVSGMTDHSPLARMSDQSGVAAMSEQSTVSGMSEQSTVSGVGEQSTVSEVSEQSGVAGMSDEDFERHFRATYGAMGKRFDEPYRSAYLFAEAESVSHPQLKDKDWYEVEDAIHQDWELSHPGTWSQVEDAIHFGWDKKRTH